MGKPPSQYLPFRQVVIIGGGLGGLGMACELKRKLNFHDFVIYERHTGLGGTWHENAYPGAAVDIPGAVYQLSFAPECSFSRIFPGRDEMHAYMLGVADRFNISSHLQCNMSWIGSTWLDDRKCWRVELQSTKTGEVSIQECKVLISATGHLVDPKRLDIPGIADFQGKIVHTVKWTKDVDLKGKNVVVLGNGSTAVQVVPAILDEVQSCTQIQRAPQWILNRQNPHVPAWCIQLMKWFPFIFVLLQNFGFALAELFYPLLGKRIPQISKRHLKQCEVPEKYHPLLTPTFSPGCKRMVFAVDYLQCLKNPKVELVQDEIVALNKTSVVTKPGRQYPCDVLVLAHGFEFETFRLPLKGRNDITPGEHWSVAGGPSCYKGCAMNGFPNFFMIRGPNMASGHNSVIYYIEVTVAIILKVATPLIRGQIDALEIKSDVEQAWVKYVQAACKRGVWGRDCSTYYVTKDGWNHTMYPWSSYRLWFDRFASRNDWNFEPLKAAPQKS